MGGLRRVGVPTSGLFLLWLAGTMRDALEAEAILLVLNVEGDGLGMHDEGCHSSTMHWCWRASCRLTGLIVASWLAYEWIGLLLAR